MRSFTLELDALACLREGAGGGEVDLTSAATLAQLAGVDAVRLGVNPERYPVREEDVRDVRRAARRFELRMVPTESLLKVALETRPDRVLLAADGPDLLPSAAPLDLRSVHGLAPILRALTDAGMATSALVAPELESVKMAHGEGLTGVEFYTGRIVDLPQRERRAEFEKLGDAVRLAAKTRLSIGLVGNLGYRVLRDVLDAAPAVDHVVVGRAAIARSVLVGLDRALRDLRALLT
ncbi:MAG: pyridoxine 5'-phosphate synthase [Myxococcales bacterium]|nr:pyridoxine 5'-phosphate synthase [Myxococcales bacterium]MDH5307777.1 pyridoxine 5'-phosphate synthase [Myxococcales bacterium]MDH5567234.1 pyridoxine 5'-phosphate synthase [Myxococcales bacterium]